MSGRRAGRRRVQAAALHHVAAVQPGGVHAHQHLAGAGRRVGVLLDEDLLLTDRDGAHRGQAYPSAVSDPSGSGDTSRSD